MNAVFFLLKFKTFNTKLGLDSMPACAAFLGSIISFLFDPSLDSSHFNAGAVSPFAPMGVSKESKALIWSIRLSTAAEICLLLFTK